MITEIMNELKAFGTEQNRKIYRRHGVGDNQFGVSVANLRALKKKIKINHALAQQLWETGNHDARNLAALIADPKQADEGLLDHWIHGADNYVMTDCISGFAASTPFARTKSEAWRESNEEWVATAGWTLVSHLAMNDKTLPDSYFLPLIARIEREIHTRKNRVRYAMNNALIAIGGRSADLKEKALQAGATIGEVHVDHGETNCETPDACAYIEKMWARKSPK